MNYVPLPWWRESAFRAWIKNSLTTLAAAIGVIEVGAIPWEKALLGAGGLILKDFLGSAYDIFFSAPDVFQQAPPSE